MKAPQQILAEKLGCEKHQIADKLFPISKGYTEKERMDYLQAIYSTIAEVSLFNAKLQDGFDSTEHQAYNR